MTNPASKEIFLKRSMIINHIRDFFTNKDFTEVETPMMHQIPVELMQNLYYSS